MKLCMEHQRPKHFIICANYDLGLTLTNLWQGQILQQTFISENVTMMDEFSGRHENL